MIKKDFKLKKPVEDSDISFSALYSLNDMQEGIPWRQANYSSKKEYTLSERDYPKILKECRYNYRHEGIVNTIIDNLVDMGITDLVIDRGDLSHNKFLILQGIKDDVVEFIKDGALEYLVTGIVFPAINFAWKLPSDFADFGVKRFSKLYLPNEMWYRNPSNIEIKESLISSSPHYYLKIPHEYITQYQKLVRSGEEGEKILAEWQSNFPDFYRALESGESKVLLDGEIVSRRKVLSDTPYPMSLIFPALNSLAHKRNIRSMDYVLASRVIAAIQKITLGNNEYPLTKGNDKQLDDLKSEIRSRNLSSNSIEQVYQLFANHTLNIEWIVPPVDALLNTEKYEEINNDILYSLGFPRVLIMGESQRSGASDHDFAILSPLATMRDIQSKLIKIVKYIFDKVVTVNGLGNYGGVKFSPVNLTKFSDFLGAIQGLYETGNISRDTYSGYLGFNIQNEIEKRKKERELLEKYNLPEYNARPFDKNTEKTQKTFIEKEEEEGDTNG